MLENKESDQSCKHLYEVIDGEYVVEVYSTASDAPAEADKYLEEHNYFGISKKIRHVVQPRLFAEVTLLPEDALYTPESNGHIPRLTSHMREHTPQERLQPLAEDSMIPGQIPLDLLS